MSRQTPWRSAHGYDVGERSAPVHGYGTVNNRRGSGCSAGPDTWPVFRLTNQELAMAKLRPCLDCGRPSEGTRCREYAAAQERRRGTTTQRDYGAEHQAQRRAWEPHVAAGLVDCRRGTLCLAPQLRIQPGEPWHLGHPDAECPAPTAPEHQGCNVDAANRLRG